MLRLTAPTEVPCLDRHAAPPSLPPHALQLGGPITDQVLRTLQARNQAKADAAIAALGDDWVFHPSRRIR